MLHVFLWIVGVLLLLVVLATVYVGLQYHKYRKYAPKPAYKRPKKRLTADDFANDGLIIGWVGHSTLYIRWNGIGILTDPVFAERIGVKMAVWTLGPKRHTAPAMNTADLRGQIDLILLSHAHMDHLDLPTLRQLATSEVEVVTSVGTSHLLHRLGFGAVRELGGSDSIQTKSGIQVTAIPVAHWGARFPWNRDYQWTGYLLEYENQKVFYAGDTAYTPTLKNLQAYGVIDVVCMPIGAYSPEFFQRHHCTPEQAWQMFQDTGGRSLIPMHHDTFVLSEEPVEEPLQRLLMAAGGEAGKIVIREHGEVFQLASSKAIQPQE